MVVRNVVFKTASKGIVGKQAEGQGHCYPWHMHTHHWTIGVVRRGAVCLTTETASRRLAQGQFFFLQPYAPHSLRVEPESFVLVACCDAQGASLLTNTPDAFFRHIPCLGMNDVRDLADVVTSCNIIDWQAHCAENCLGHSLAASSIRESLRVLLANPAEPLPLPQLAAHVGYSQWHFLRVFEKMTGMTPHAFQLLCRLRLLRNLLRTDTAAVDAAVSAGFADQSHMHKVFRRHHGMTPGAFKKASVRLEL